MDCNRSHRRAPYRHREFPLCSQFQLSRAQGKRNSWAIYFTDYGNYQIGYCDCLPYSKRHVVQIRGLVLIPRRIASQIKMAEFDPSARLRNPNKRVHCSIDFRLAICEMGKYQLRSVVNDADSRHGNQHRYFLFCVWRETISCLTLWYFFYGQLCRLPGFRCGKTHGKL